MAGRGGSGWPGNRAAGGEIADDGPARAAPVVHEQHLVVAEVTEIADKLLVVGTGQLGQRSRSVVEPEADLGDGAAVREAEDGGPARVLNGARDSRVLRADRGWATRGQQFEYGKRRQGAGSCSHRVHGYLSPLRRLAADL